MRRRALIDTGPLVAYLNARDHYHSWIKQEFADLTPPLFTCEAVISETCFLLRRWPQASQAVLELVRRGVLMTSFRLDAEIVAVQRLMKRYANVPMSLADACLVRMAELLADSVVLTCDGDFRRYRRHGRQLIPVVTPDPQ
ncbi:MAG: type II toxin-antitoxin system VapC family toxin [Chromatiales bacterium]